MRNRISVLLCLSFLTAGSALYASRQISPEDLLRTTPRLIEAEYYSAPEDLVVTSNREKKLKLGTKAWWPSLPEFYQGFNPAPGEEFYVVQAYAKPKDPAHAKLDTALTLYKNNQSAQHALMEMIKKDSQGSIRVQGHRVGDFSQYFMSKAKSYQSRGAKQRTYTVRFRQGRIVGRITSSSDRTPEPVFTLERYAHGVVNRLQQLQAGQLKTEKLPVKISSALPPVKVSKQIGTPLGSVVIPAESWALIDTQGNPEKVLKTLHQGGVYQLAFRRYSIRNVKGHVIDLTLFEFKNEKVAAHWVKRYLDEARKSGALNPGKTGSLSAFSFNKGASLYELQFAKGRYVCDVCGIAPFDPISPACKEPVRKLAEIWYASLPSASKEGSTK